ncbi:MAG: class II fructose-bisphosphate aldolase [Gemmatimonadota bacterium]
MSAQESTIAHAALGDAVTRVASAITVHDASVLATDRLDGVVWDAVFGDATAKDYARWLLWELGQAVGVRPASIHELYLARGRGEVRGFTVPAMNVRGATYDTARSIFRVAKRMEAGAFLLEIARSEIAYTEQRPTEYVAVLIASALREGFRGPLFIQGDHFQVNHKKYAADPVTEVNNVKKLADEAIAAGFYNIDVDTSTLVDLSQATLEEQQRKNYEECAGITTYIRSQEPKGVTISIGGEIGEVGTENSTVPELRAFVDGFRAALECMAPGTPGLSKISVQSGTSHGGIVLPDGSIAEVSLDLKTLEDLSKVAREEYGMSGAVQHGASTLPDTAFNNFPRTETAEIHLATNFQNMLYDHLPVALRDEIYAWLLANAIDERKATDSDEQFFYKTRKKALGPFKERLWQLDGETKAKLSEAYDEKFTFLFTQLAIGGTKHVVKQTVKPLSIRRPMPGTPGHIVVEAAPDDASLSD